MAIQPSKYQQAIYKWIKEGSGNIVVQAVAGSGKTFTIIEAAKLLPRHNRNLFVAFNRAIADELKKKLPSHVSASTLHGMGYAIIINNSDVKPKVDGGKTTKIINEVVDNYIDEGIISSRSKWEKRGMLRKIITKIKNLLLDYKDFDKLEEVRMRFNIEEKINKKEDIKLIEEVLDKCRKERDTIDFDDMLWLPVVEKMTATKYDWVFADECQDISMVQIELIKLVTNKKTRIIFVGDRKQSIYAFRGADVGAMDRIEKEFNAVTMPLSICYRCPQSHIRLAKEFVPQIEAWDKNREGQVNDIKFDEALRYASDGDLVLCRTNAPLVRMAFGLIREGKKAVIRGRDIGKGLIKLINTYAGVYDIVDLLIKINDVKRNEERKLKEIMDGNMDYNLKGRTMTMIDTCETILFIAEGMESIGALKDRITMIFSDENEGIICSTVHKAKGLQADKVFILRYDLMPHPMAKNEEEMEQEMNIKYVALTRSKNYLNFVE